MTKITNIGKEDRMVADRILRPGESKEITPKQAELLEGDTDFEIAEEVTPTPVDTSTAAVSGLDAAVGLDTPMSTSATRPAKVSRRGKKK